VKDKFLKNPFHIAKLFFRSDGNFGLKAVFSADNAANQRFV
jgi:hypothetical protein